MCPMGILPPPEVHVLEVVRLLHVSSLYTGMDLDFRVGLAEATVGLAYKCKLQIAMLHCDFWADPKGTVPFSTGLARTLMAAE